MIVRGRFRKKRERERVKGRRKCLFYEGFWYRNGKMIIGFRVRFVEFLGE